MSDDRLDNVMLNTYRNRFLRIIESGPLDVQQFRPEERTVNGKQSFVLKYTGTPFEFVLARREHSFDHFQWTYTLFIPNYPLDAWNPPGGGHIDGAYRVFSQWMKDHLKRYLDELAEPDLWAQIQSQKPVVSDAPVSSDDREPYTDAEQTQLRMAIKEFRQLVIDKFEPTEDHLSLIDDRLDYLSEQVSQLNRINWRSLAFSTLVAISIALSLNQEQGKELFELFKQVFSNVVLLLQ